jgi:hypothetical protein
MQNYIFEVVRTYLLSTSPVMKKITFTLLLFCVALLLQAQVTITVTNCSVGDLTNRLSASEKSSVANLTITGYLDARDFKTMRDDLPVLSVLNIGSTSILGYTGSDGPISPTSFSYPADELPWYAFYNYSTGYGKNTLTNVTLPSSITSIGRYAFGYCRNISTLAFPSTVSTIQNWAFTDCGNNLAITIPAATTTIQNLAFEAFNGPINVDGSNPNYSSLNEVLFNKDKTTLIQCPASKSGDYIVPSTVTLIGQNSFSRCTRLNGYITIPPSVTTIGGWAFRECGVTGPLTIPESVDSIGNGAFNWCTALTSIYVYSKVPIDIRHSSSVFDMINKTTCTLYVPATTKNAYLAANQWGDFENIVEGPSSFPYSEGFSSGASPYGWRQVDYQAKDQIWKFGTINLPSMAPDLIGNYVYLYSDAYGSSNTQNVDLISPVFDFSNYTNIELSFNHFFRPASSNQGSMYYSVDNGVDWTLIQSWNSTLNPETFSLNLTSQVAGYSHVFFKWNYSGTWGLYWAIDDVAITADYEVGTTETLTNTSINGDESHCYDASETITVAGGGVPVEFLSGSFVDLIAGQTISFLPGFHANNGSEMHAYITTTGDFCNALPSPVIAMPADEKSTLVADETVRPVVSDRLAKSIKIYPNPNNGKFTIALTNIELGSGIAIYNALGIKVYQTLVLDATLPDIDMAGLRRGLYFVKVTDGKEQFTKKMIVE